MNTLADLVNSDIPIIAETATKALELTRLREQNKISEKEFKDLLLDITRIDIIDKSMYSAEVYNRIYEAFKVILAVQAVLPII